MKEQKKIRSKELENFLNFVDECMRDYTYNQEKLTTEENLTQDLLHSLELGDMKCDERSKVATRLAINRKDRRYYKDVVEEVTPVCEFFNESSTKAVLNKMRELLGKLRKVEAYHACRTYFPRVKE